MKKTSKTGPAFSIPTLAKAILLGLILTAGTTSGVYAQGQVASGTISGSGVGLYTYNLSFKDAAAATSPIGSVWYSWVPGAFFLPGTPSAASAPAGWSAVIDANSVQFIASAPANFIQPGQTLIGFSYQASFSPAQLAAAPNSGVSVAYSGGLFSDNGNTFTVQTVAVPEPSVSTLLISGLVGLFWVSRSIRVTPCSTRPVRYFSHQ